MRARFWVLALLAACGGGGGDSGKPGGAGRGDGAPVEVVERQTGGRPLPGEREPNDADDQASPLAFPGGVRGNLDGQTDVDVYRFTLAARTLVEARLTGSGVDLVLELHARDALLAHSDRGPAGAVEGFPGFPLDPGDYLLVVREFVKKPPAGKGKKKAKAEPPPPPPRTGPSPPYQLTVAAAAPAQAGQEVEPNADNAAAGEIALGQEAVGFLGWTDDVDLWRVDITGLGAGYSLDFEVVVPEGAEATMTLLDDNADKVLDRGGGRGESVAVRGLVPQAGNEHYYVKVTARRSHPDEPYTLRATTRLHDLDLESEPNDGSKSATALRDDPRENGGTRRGWLGAGDADYWRLPPGPAGSLSVTVTPPPEVDVKLAVVAGAAKAESFVGKRGVAERVDAVAVGGREPVIIKVSGSGSSASPYELRWSMAEPIYDPYAEPDE